MTKDQQATPIPEELYNLTQLADVTLAAGPLSTAAKAHATMPPSSSSSSNTHNNSSSNSCGSSNNSIAYASSDDDSTFNSYSHKVFDRRKLRRCTNSDTNSCASITSIASNNSSSSQSSVPEILPVQTGGNSSGNSSCSGSGSSLDDEHICPECGKKYSTSSNLARHRQTHR